jgi:hypothetical protein
MEIQRASRASRVDGLAFSDGTLVNNMISGSIELMVPFAVGKVAVGGARFSDHEVVRVKTVRGEREATRLELSVFAQQQQDIWLNVERLVLVKPAKEAFLRQSEPQLLFETAWSAVAKSDKTRQSPKAIHVVQTKSCGLGLKLKSATVALIAKETDLQSVRVERGHVLVNALGLCGTQSVSGKTLVKWSVALWKRVTDVRGVSVFSVTQRAVQVNKGENVNPWARSLWALGRSVSAECGELLGGHVMVDVEDAKGDMEAA